MVWPIKLDVLSERMFSTKPGACQLVKGSPTCSPTIDLVALVAEASVGGSVCILRADGESVSRISPRRKQHAQALRWKPDGKSARSLGFRMKFTDCGRPCLF